VATAGSTDPPASLAHLDTIDVILTSDCNLRCSYCYQDAKRPGVMSWRVLRRALDLLLGSRQDAVRVYFVGGEPLLAFDLIARAVEYVARQKRPSQSIGYDISTNGLLLGSREAEFLDSQGFQLKLSFDGVPEMQRLRGAATFSRLDRLLDVLRARHPSLFVNRLSVQVTLVPESIPFLAATLEYLIRKQVRDIVVAPASSNGRCWNRRRYKELHEQVERAFRLSLRHYRRTGRVPLRWFRPGPSTREEPTDWYCGIAGGQSLTGEVDGTLHGCSILARTYQRFPSSKDCRPLDRLRMGTIGEPGLAARQASYRKALEATGFFSNRAAKRSLYGRCATCRARFDCVLCPGQIIRGTGVWNRVPDFACAFNRLCSRYRNRFPTVPRPPSSRGVVALDVLGRARRFLIDVAGRSPDALDPHPPRRKAGGAAAGTRRRRRHSIAAASGG
jgi:sulfatase maturation enzyme AslB (radical SAM superfamily)